MPGALRTGPREPSWTTAGPPASRMTRLGHLRPSRVQPVTLVDRTSMPHRPERFLRTRTGLSRKAALGRVFNVTRESWRLTDDPSLVVPEAEQMASRRTASDAADLARQAAVAFARHGFHKPSASWWGADEVRFHRFVVHAGRRPRRGHVAVASALFGLAAVVLWRGRRQRAPTPAAAASEPGAPDPSGRTASGT
jgi:hypothetical protein